MNTVTLFELPAQEAIQVMSLLFSAASVDRQEKQVWMSVCGCQCVCVCVCGMCASVRVCYVVLCVWCVRTV